MFNLIFLLQISYGWSFIGGINYLLKLKVHWVCDSHSASEDWSNGIPLWAHHCWQTGPLFCSNLHSGNSFVWSESCLGNLKADIAHNLTLLQRYYLHFCHSISLLLEGFSSSVLTLEKWSCCSIKCSNRRAASDSVPQGAVDCDPHQAKISRMGFVSSNRSAEHSQQHPWFQAR